MLYWGIHFPNRMIIGFKEFPEDQLIFYKGYYGVPSYLIWYARPWPDKPHITNVGDVFEFLLFEAPRDFDTWGFNYRGPDFEDDMVVESIIYDVTKQMFKITAVSHFWKLLSTTRLITHVELGKRDAPVGGIEVIEKLVDISTAGENRWHMVSSSATINRVEYVHINIDPEVSALDLITKICLENGWEWYIGKGDIDGVRSHVLYVGEKLLVSNAFALPFNPEPEHAKVMETTMFKTLTTESIWAEPMLLYGKPIDSRVIWIKVYLGNHGGLMTLMLHKLGKNIFQHMTENDYIYTLDGLARIWGEQRQWKIMRSFPVLIGKIHGEIDTEDIDAYEWPTFSGDLNTFTKDLATRTFKTNYGPNERPFYQTKNNKMTTPYAGNGVGVQYPQDESHRLLFAPDGERDVALVGPAYYGPGDEVPYRIGSDDYRLQFPDGTVIYNKNDNTFYIIGSNQIDLKIGGLNANQDPGSAGSTPVISIKNGEINIQYNISTQVKLTDSGIVIRGQQIDGLQPTLKITKGQVEILGNLKVTGMVDCISAKTATLTNIDGAVLKKIPPGP